MLKTVKVYITQISGVKINGLSLDKSTFIKKMIWMTPKNIYLVGLTETVNRSHLRCYYKPFAPPEQMTKTKAPAERPAYSPSGATCKYVHCIHANIFQE